MMSRFDSFLFPPLKGEGGSAQPIREGSDPHPLALLATSPFQGEERLGAHVSL